MLYCIKNSKQIEGMYKNVMSNMEGNKVWYGYI